MHDTAQPAKHAIQRQAAKQHLFALPKPPAERVTPIRPRDPQSINFWAGVRFLERQGWSLVSLEGEPGASWCVFRRCP